MGWERRLFVDYVAAFGRHVDRLAPSDFGRGRHRATIASGGAGLAFALWRAGGRLDRSTFHRQARQIVSWIPAGAEGVGRFRVSVAYGSQGVALVRALVSARETAFLTAGGRGPLDLYLGRSGLLSAAGLLRDRRGVAAIGDGIFDQLASRPRSPTPRVVQWAVAHGRAGTLLAMLEWARQGTRALPAWAVAELEEGARRGRREREGRSWPGDPRSRTGMFCAGAAGMALLWVKAFEHTGTGLFLDAARDAAAHALSRTTLRPTLCCGAPGVAYAALALARHRPRDGWRARATALAARTLLRPDPVAGYGLLNGEAGLLCLAADLVSGAAARMPLFEA